MKEIPRSGAVALVATGQFEIADGSVRYLGNSGNYSKNEFGTWAAPGAPESDSALNARSIESDAVTPPQPSTIAPPPDDDGLN